MYQSKDISVLIIVLVLVCAGQAAADFNKCFGTCVIGCILGDDKFLCTSKCFAKCILNPGSAPISSNLYCKFGCAIAQCAQFGDGMYYYLHLITFILALEYILFYTTFHLWRYV